MIPIKIKNRWGHLYNVFSKKLNLLQSSFSFEQRRIKFP